MEMSCSGGYGVNGGDWNGGGIYFIFAIATASNSTIIGRLRNSMFCVV
jgi:hypothetical protein